MKVRFYHKNFHYIGKEFMQIELLPHDKSIQLFHRYIEELTSTLEDISEIQEPDSHFKDFDRYVLLLKDSPTTRLNADTPINESTNLLIIFPERNPLILIELNSEFKEYYCVDKYNNRDTLQNILENSLRYTPIASIIKQTRFDKLQINGAVVNYDKQRSTKMDTFIEGHINSIINILIRLKTQQSLSNSVKLEEKLQNKIVKQDQAIDNIAIKVCDKKQIIQSKNSDLQMVIQFLSDNGARTEKQFRFDFAKNLSEVLPKIIQDLKSAGFDWNELPYEHKKDSDQLRIICKVGGNSQEFRKYETPFKALFSPNQRVQFVINRHQFGG